MSVYLKNAGFVDWKTLEFRKANLKVLEGQGKGFEFVDNLPDSERGEPILDCTDKLVTHAFACGHHHVYSALARGMRAPRKIPANFYEILKYVWWNLDVSLDKEMIKASALATALDCVKNGVCFVADHHASPGCIEGSLDVIAEAFEKVGISHLLCYEITDRGGLEPAEKGLAETEDYLKKRQGLVGLHASFTVGDKSLNKAVELATRFNSGIHVHVAEDVYDQDQCLENYGVRVVERLKRAGVLDLPKSILSHCLHLDKNERKLIRESNAWVVQNTESNLNNRVGYFNSEGLGGRIMTGTDGMHSDMLRSAKAAFLVGQGFDLIDCPEAYRRFRNVHHYISENGLSGDGENNLVVLDYDTPTEIGPDNFYGHFIYGLASRHIRHLISNGRLVLRDRELVTVVEKEILEFSREQANRLWKKMK